MNEEINILTHSFLDGYNQRFDRVFGGGLERYALDLCRLIKELGYRPVVRQLSYYESFQREYEGISVYGYAYDLDRPSETFERMAEQARGPVIYGSFIWRPLRYRPGSLAICHGLNWDFHRLDNATKRAVATAAQGALDQTRKIVSVDSHFLSFCRSVCSFSDPNHIVVIPNAVDTDFFVASEQKNHSDAIRVLFPRRLSQERGLIPMMWIADELLRADPRVIVEFAGEKVNGHPLTEAFSLWREHHPYGDRIEHRVYSFEQIVEGYRKADIVVIPTIYSEGTSYACLEALSCGKAVVATNVGGLNDLIIDGYNGRLVSPDPENILAAIRQLIDDEQARDALAERARETARAFDLRHWKERWKRVLIDWLDEWKKTPFT